MDEYEGLRRFGREVEKMKCGHDGRESASRERWMTGVERLRGVAGFWRENRLDDIVEQIEREQGEHVSRMRVLAVITDMERHVLGHEGMEDSPVARWARELRDALGGEGRDPAADGKSLREGETVWGTNGGLYRITGVHDGEVFALHISGSFGAEVGSAGGSGLYRLRADQLTHERPEIDSWERLEDDASKSSCEYFEQSHGCGSCPKYPSSCGYDKARDLVRRARALAGGE